MLEAALAVFLLLYFATVAGLAHVLGLKRTVRESLELLAELARHGEGRR